MADGHTHREENLLGDQYDWEEGAPRCARHPRRGESVLDDLAVNRPGEMGDVVADVEGGDAAMGVVGVRGVAGFVGAARAVDDALGELEDAAAGRVGVVQVGVGKVGFVAFEDVGVETLGDVGVETLGDVGVGETVEVGKVEVGRAEDFVLYVQVVP